MMVVGIDPGKSGGIAILREDGHLVRLYRMPKTEAEVARLLSAVIGVGVGAVFVEKQWARPNDGKMQISTFLRHTGFILGCLETLRASKDIPLNIVEVAPQVWQKSFGVTRITKDRNISAYRAKKEHKLTLVRTASELFPAGEITLNTADALLIAEYGRRLWLKKAEAA